MTEALKNSLNLSNEFRLKELNDPINYKVSLRDSVPELSEIPSRFTYKERKIKERDSFGGYRYYSDNLKKRKNPTEEYRKQLEEELIKKKKMLSEYEANGGQLSQEQINTIKNGNSFPNTLNQFNFFSSSYFNDINDINTKDVEYFKNLSANENLIKVLDSQVDLLKKRGNEQFKKISLSDDYDHLLKTKKYGRILKNQEMGLEEPGVYSQFLAANENRVQTLKHVITQDKPEYIPLEDLNKIKEEHQKELLDIEDEYYGRKKVSEEELIRIKEEKKKLKRLKELHNMIQRPGYNNDNPLEEQDYDFINKYNNYLINKQGNIDKIGYEEEWNTTKVKSQNANGIIDRKDGLPGYLDQDDYKLYYYDINEEGGELNFERPLKTHKHIGRENTLKRTFRNEPGYEKTKGKFFSSGSMPNMFNNINIKDNSNNLINGVNKLRIINDKKNVIEDDNDNYDEENELDTKLEEKNEQFIKLIFKMLSKNEKGEVPKNKIIKDMKLDENSMKELGFQSKEDFEKKLNKYPSKNKDFMTEEEFHNFLLQKKKKIKPKKNLKEKEIPNLNININKKEEEVLPGMSTSYFDFLRNPSTTARLSHINKTLDAKKINYKKININKKNVKDNNINRNFSNIRKQKLNKSVDTEKNENEQSNFYQYNSAINAHFNMNNYSKKSDLNFTIPKPFEFLKEDYHGKKLIKMREILEERKKNEQDVFHHTFHANPLNRKMFDTNGDLRNVIERERAEREKRITKKKKEIKAHMRPFSFYEKDFKSFYERKNKECIPPQFVPFKANPIQYKSQVNMYEGSTDYAKKKREERIHQRALSTFNAASLPPRMEMHEKQKKLQEEEKKMVEQRRQQEEKNKRFKYKRTPDFKELQEKFDRILESKKKAHKPTKPRPFTFHEPKKKVELCQYLDFENNPKSKNPKKENKIEEARKKMQKKPDIEPPSTKSLKLLMDKRRKDLEERKKREERIKREDEARIEKQKRLNERVRSSSVIRGNKKELELKRKNDMKEFSKKLKETKKEYSDKLKVIKQNVENRPLMMEVAVNKKDVFDMKQDEDNKK